MGAVSLGAAGSSRISPFSGTTGTVTAWPPIHTERTESRFFASAAPILAFWADSAAADPLKRHFRSTQLYRRQRKRPICTYSAMSIQSGLFLFPISVSSTCNLVKERHCHGKHCHHQEQKTPTEVSAESIEQEKNLLFQLRIEGRPNLQECLQRRYREQFRFPGLQLRDHTHIRRYCKRTFS